MPNIAIRLYEPKLLRAKRAENQTPAMIGRQLSTVFPKKPNPSIVKIAAIVGPASVTEEKYTTASPMSATNAAFTIAPPVPIVVKSCRRRDPVACIVIRSPKVFTGPSAMMPAVRRNTRNSEMER